MKLETIYNDVPFEVEGNYYKGSIGSYEYPPEGSEFEITKILINGIDVYQILSDWQLTEIEEQIINELYEYE